MASTTAEPVGQSGCRDLIERVLQQKGLPPRHVSLATAGSQGLMSNDIAQSDCQSLSQDTFREQSILVYKHFTDDLLSLAQNDLPIGLAKRIIKGKIAALHNRNIVHTDVKANNISVERENDHHGIFIERVQLAEAHMQGCVNTPSEILSLGIACIYAVLKQVIFTINDEEPLSMVLERQVSYFADEEGLNRLLRQLGDSPWCEVFEVIRDGFDENNPRKPFALWKNVEADFIDLIGGLTSFDPAKRLTAHEALTHRWFREV